MECARANALSVNAPSTAQVPEGIFVTSTPARADGSVLEQLAEQSGSLILQRQRSDCWTAGPVIVTLRYPGVQNAKREGEREGSDDDYGFGHHGSPLGF